VTETRVRKLSREDVTEMVRLAEQGMTQAAIAARFGVTGSAVNYRLAQRRARPNADRIEGHFDHGTRRGYQQHRAAGGIPCEECRRANSAYMRTYSQSRVKKGT
jgi:transposase-like protein